MEKQVAKLERRMENAEAAILQIIEATQSQSEMLDDYFRGLRELRQSIAELRESQANTDVKIAALVDAQIRAEYLVQARAAEQEKRAAEQEKRAAEQEKRAAEQEKRAAEQEKRAAEQEARMTQHEARMAQHEARMAQHEAQMAELRQTTANLALIMQAVVKERAD